MAETASTSKSIAANKHTCDSGLDFHNSNMAITALPDWKQTQWKLITGIGLRYDIFPSGAVDEKGWLIVSDNVEYKKLLAWLVS